MGINVWLQGEEEDPGRQWVQKEVGSPPKMGDTAPLSHFTMDIFVRGQAGAILQQEPLKDGSSRRHLGRNRNCNNGYRHEDFKEQLHLRMDRTSDRIFRQALVV
jgi:hypothetical protein